MIEPLESRIAPAILLHYVDGDGDDVTIRVSKGTLADAQLIWDASGHQLEKLDLGAEVFAGARVSVTALPSAAGGDGFADVGWLHGPGFGDGGEPKAGFESVLIDGDLGKFTNSGLGVDPSESQYYRSAFRAVGDFHVGSLGMLGTSTGAPDLVSVFVGWVVRWRVDGDIGAAHVILKGNAGQVFVGGSIHGGAGTDSGSIFITGDATRVWVKGSVFGGAGMDSGRIGSEAGRIKLVQIDGDLVGGAGKWSGMLGPHREFLFINGIFPPINGRFDHVRIGGDVVGGTGEDAGGVYNDFVVPKVTVLGDVRAGGYIAPWGAGSITVRGDVDAGRIEVATLNRLWIGGAVMGGDADRSGYIYVKDRLMNLRIDGGIKGGVGFQSGNVIISRFENLSYSIRGDIEGGLGIQSGRLSLDHAYKGTIRGDIVGGIGEDSGTFIGYALKQAKIIGDVVGGAGAGSGLIRFNNINQLSIAGSVSGSGGISGGIFSLDGPHHLLISGDVVDAIIGAGFDKTGTLKGPSPIGEVKIGGDFVRSTITAGVNAGTDGQYGTGDDLYIDFPGGSSPPVLLKSVTIGGRVLTDAGHYGIVAHEIGEVRIGGQKMKLTLGGDNDVIECGVGSHFTIREIPGP